MADEKYSSEILDNLDSVITQSPYNFFIDLNEGYFYPAGSRLTLYGDKKRWAIVFEKSGYHTRVGTFQNVISYYGNCLIDLKPGSNDKWTSNTIHLPLIDGEELQAYSSDFETLSPKVDSLPIHGQYVKVEHDPKKYADKEIELLDNESPKPSIDYVSFIRYLFETQPDVLWATDEEKRTHLPKDLPEIMKIDCWHHKEYYFGNGVVVGDKPSSYETYMLISKVLETSDPSLWKPTLKCNNHWSFWPDAGNL